MAGKRLSNDVHERDFFAALDILRLVAKKHGFMEVECTLRWVTHHSILKGGRVGDAVIISTKHLEENLVDAGWEKQARYLEGIGIE